MDRPQFVALERTTISPTYIWGDESEEHYKKNKERKVVIIIILYSFYFLKWKKETSRESEKWARTRSYEYWKRKLKTRVYDCCDKDRESSLLFLLINFFVFSQFILPSYCVFHFVVFLYVHVYYWHEYL